MRELFSQELQVVSGANNYICMDPTQPSLETSLLIKEHFHEQALLRGTLFAMTYVAVAATKVQSARDAGWVALGAPFVAALGYLSARVFQDPNNPFE